jgi:heme/copper-type cytochrome/quinol oxidase subunit 2
MHEPADWVVLILVGGVLSFFAYVVIKSRQEEKKDKKGDHDR